MARRKPPTRNPRPGGGYASTVSSALVICLAVGVVLLGRIRLKNEEARRYSEINRTEDALNQLRRFNLKLVSDLETLTSPAGLHARILEMRLDLSMPGDDARIVLPEPLGEPGLPGPTPAPSLPVAPDENLALGSTGRTPPARPARSR